MGDTFQGEVVGPAGKDYVPNTRKVSPLDPISDSGAVVGTGFRERKAPRLMVLYACPECNRTSVLNAYDGVPSCKDHGSPVFLEGVRLVF